MREHLIRASFSFLAAAVTLSMAGEWTVWAVEQRKGWKLAPATFLVGMALFEANQVRQRGERLLSISAGPLDPASPSPHHPPPLPSPRP